VFLLNLDDLPVREPLPAAGTLAGLRPGNGGGDDVLASLVPVLEVLTFTALSATTENYLVEAGGVVLARDVPDAVPREGDLA
jgi:hypothetical protein